MTAVALVPEEGTLIDRLCGGDEEAFSALVDLYGASLQRVATAIVGSRAVAEEVVQETWLAVFSGIERFERRASLKTWLFRIATNLAKTRAARERRSVPMSALAGDDGEPTVAEERFFGPEAGYPGHWASVPPSWHDVPEERLATAETLTLVAEAIASLPPLQRAVITARHLEGRPAEDVCSDLDLTDGNQRVLLHRACAKVRQALEDALGTERA